MTRRREMWASSVLDTIDRQARARACRRMRDWNLQFPEWPWSALSARRNNLLVQVYRIPNSMEQNSCWETASSWVLSWAKWKQSILTHPVSYPLSYYPTLPQNVPPSSIPCMVHATPIASPPVLSSQIIKHLIMRYFQIFLLRESDEHIKHLQGRPCNIKGRNFFTITVIPSYCNLVQVCYFLTPETNLHYIYKLGSHFKRAGWHSCNVLDSYSGGAWFESSPGRPLS
jgi:hypothetical protein